MILSTFSQIYIDWNLIIAKVSDVILFFIKITDGIWGGGGAGCPISVIFLLRITNNSIFLYLIQEK